MGAILGIHSKDSNSSLNSNSNINNNSNSIRHHSSNNINNRPLPSNNTKRRLSNNTRLPRGGNFSRLRISLLLSNFNSLFNNSSIRNNKNSPIEVPRSTMAKACPLAEVSASNVEWKAIWRSSVASSAVVNSKSLLPSTINPGKGVARTGLAIAKSVWRLSRAKVNSIFLQLRTTLLVGPT